VIGIYKITNIVNNKLYIGQTIRMKARWKEHKKELNDGSHNNIHLQNSWNKYSQDNFKFEVIEECKREELNDRNILDKVLRLL